jgi:hypothetical protein
MMAIIVSLGKVELPHLISPRTSTMTTKPTMSLAELAAKGADTDLLREMIPFVAQLQDFPVEDRLISQVGDKL